MANHSLGVSHSTSSRRIGWSTIRPALLCGFARSARRDFSSFGKGGEESLIFLKSSSVVNRPSLCCTSIFRAHMRVEVKEYFSDMRVVLLALVAARNSNNLTPSLRYNFLSRMCRQSDACQFSSMRTYRSPISLIDPNVPA